MSDFTPVVRAHRIRLPVQTGLTSLTALTLGMWWAPTGLFAVLLGVFVFLGSRDLQILGGLGPVLGIPLVLSGQWLFRHGVERVAIARRRKPSDLILDADGVSYTHDTSSEPGFVAWRELAPEGCTLEEFTEDREPRYLLPPEKPEDRKPRSVTVTRLHVQKRDREWIFVGQAESPAELEVLQAVHAALRGGASQPEPSSEDEDLEPISALPLVRCSECGAAQRVTDAERAHCPYCGQQVDMPTSHVVQLRDLRRSAAQQASIEAALCWLMREPPAPRAQWTANAWCLSPVAIVSPVVLYLSVDALLHTRWLDAMLWASITPLLALSVYSLRRVPVARRHAMRALTLRFGARPPRKSGEDPSCHGCGAPLSHGADSLEVAIRCTYCKADNLLQLDLGTPLASLRRQAQGLDEAVAELRRSIITLRWVGGVSGLALAAVVALRFV